MRKTLLLVLLLAGASAGAQTQEVTAIRAAYAAAKEVIAEYEKNPEDVTQCSKTETVSDYYVNPGIGPVHEVVCYYHYGVDFEGDVSRPCHPFFITRSLGQKRSGHNTYEEYLFNDRRQLVFYFRKEDGNEVRYYWSDGRLIDQKVKGSPEMDETIAQRIARNLSNTLLRMLLPEGFYADDDKGDPHDKIYSLLDGAASPDGYVMRYKDEMERLASEDNGEVVFDMYALVDIDGDGRAEILARTNEEFETFAAFAVGSGKPELLLLFDPRGVFVFFQGAVGYQGGCGTGCHMGEYAVLKNSRLATKYLLIDQYDMNGDESPEDCVYYQDGQDIPAAEARKLFEPGGPMSKETNYEPDWQSMPGIEG